MHTKAAQVRAAIADCDRWYAARSRNIRTLNETINAFWIEIEYHTRRMDLAEAQGMEASVDFHLQRILDYVMRIYALARAER